MIAACRNDRGRRHQAGDRRHRAAGHLDRPFRAGTRVSGRRPVRAGRFGVRPLPEAAGRGAFAVPRRGTDVRLLPDGLLLPGSRARGHEARRRGRFVSRVPHAFARKPAKTRSSRISAAALRSKRPYYFTTIVTVAGDVPARQRRHVLRVIREGDRPLEPVDRLEGERAVRVQIELRRVGRTENSTAVSDGSGLSVSVSLLSTPRGWIVNSVFIFTL